MLSSPLPQTMLSSRCPRRCCRPDDVVVGTVAPHDVVVGVAPDDVVHRVAGDVAPDDVVVPEAPHHVRRPDVAQVAVAPHDVVVVAVAPDDVVGVAPHDVVVDAPDDVVALVVAPDDVVVGRLPQTMLSSLPQTMLSPLPQTMLSSLPQTMLSPAGSPSRCCRRARRRPRRYRRPSGTGAAGVARLHEAIAVDDALAPVDRVAVGVAIRGGEPVADPVRAARHVRD